MDTMSAFLKGEANRRPERVFDWNKAASLIRERGLAAAGAGLSGDLEWTGGDILKGGRPVPQEETYTFLASTWATPVLTLGGGEEIPCWAWESDTPGWDSGTYWPESALAILAGADHSAAA